MSLGLEGINSEKVPIQIPQLVKISSCLDINYQFTTLAITIDHSHYQINVLFFSKFMNDFKKQRTKVTIVRIDAVPVYYPCLQHLQIAPIVLLLTYCVIPVSCPNRGNSDVDTEVLLN